jgi:hypothetical protein
MVTIGELINHPSYPHSAKRVRRDAPPSAGRHHRAHTDALNKVVRFSACLLANFAVYIRRSALAYSP